MHNRSAGKIKNSHIFQPAALPPNPVAEGIINQSSPKQTKQQETFEFDTLYKGTCYQSRGNYRKHHLKSGEKRVGDSLAVVIIRQRSYSLKPQKVQASDQPADIRTEGERITV
ncbi:MAG: hypothetical protein A4E71_01613 [Smithella sp. PtaU1.Bin162]|nr:MAG: hypothetical protein A4E71_01613 [Smithella sp. PtaU1.Bin162]